MSDWHSDVVLGRAKSPFSYELVALPLLKGHGCQAQAQKKAEIFIMGKLLPPGYTQIPNEVLDNMYRMSQSEFCVVIAICRKTFGWHKETDRISLSQFEKLTGMSLPTIRHGIESALSNEWIVRHNTPDGYVYGLNITMKESLPPPIQDSLPTKETL